MDRSSMAQLRLDRRLIRRRGWISAEALSDELDNLPDVSHKAAPQSDDPEPSDPVEPGDPV
ncbi:MAG: hypothetical protein QNK04_15465 [Myxococcota bacterium]|nr:hypothetical protein [Myxococcota bacterium]